MTTTQIDTLYRQAIDDATHNTTIGNRFMGAFQARDVRGYPEDSPTGRLYVTCYLSALPTRIVTDTHGVVIQG